MRFPDTAYNRVTVLGAAIAVLAFCAFVFLVLFHTFVHPSEAPYAGLVIFVGVPAFLIVGLTLIPLGMMLEWARWRREGTRRVPRLPRIDLNDPRHLAAALIFSVGSVVLLFLTAFGSYEAYEVTESVPFCGTLCHTVMRPEFTTYERSPHARVACVDCHVGPGADWFVKSKLSGLYQVYAVAADTYPRPIPTPISSLRPSRETCEQCHWPNQFFGGKQKRLVHFLPDDRNTPWVINMLVKIGGGTPETGLTQGIHWHMNIGNQVEYIATDPERQQIPWVRITNRRTGEQTTYVAKTSRLSAADLARATPRTMDCMDCHNRPAHIMRSPSEAVNLALESGEVDRDLPLVKRTAVELLAAKYASEREALAKIGDGLTRFYAARYPDVAARQATAVAQAARMLQTIYQRNFFPDMRTRWDVHPDNLGHLQFPGCFRCHDGRHVSETGKVITHSCTACHVILGQGPPSSMEYATTPEGLVFRHPEDIGADWQTMTCTDCHTGTAP